MNYRVTALKTDSIFVIQEIDPTFMLVSFILTACAFYVIIDRLVVRRNAHVRSKSDPASR